MPVNVLRTILKSLQASYLRSFLFAAVTWAVLSETGFAQEASAGLHYLKAGRPNAAELLAAPPPAGSSEQAADLAMVVAVSKACSSNDVALAFSEKKFSIFTFAPAIGNFLSPGKLPQTEAFFERVQQDAATVADLGKVYWKRPRPYTLEPSLAAGKLEKSFSYPSGHATEGMVLALVLAELFPEHREAILEIGRNIGWHRVWIARHYPTDIYAGRVLAQAIVRELKASHDFERDFAQVAAEIRLVLQAEQADRGMRPSQERSASK
jgi:acid phosphatase (class A)